jgi:hypothetical protein
MARIHSKQWQQTLHTDDCNIKRTHGTNTTKHEIHVTKEQNTPTEEIDEATREDFTLKENLPQRIHEVYTTITDMDSKVYTDLTGIFLTTSSRGKTYMLILYGYNGNTILAEPMKSKADAEAVRAYTVIYKQLTDAGLIQNFQIMDNEASAAVKSFLEQHGISYQLVPPHVHRRNAAE